jgi:hypothetical protein
MKMNDETMAELERLRKENADLKSKSPVKELSLRVSEKGCISLYGMGRFPVTLYCEQWERVLAFAPQIQSFIEANRDRLKTKS